MNKKATIIILCVVTVIFVIIGINFYLNRPESSAIKTFSENFIRDFSTYQMSNTEEYNEKLTKYINSSYLEDFQSRYNLQKQAFVTPEKLQNYSEYIESTITSEEIRKNIFRVHINYSTKRKNSPAKELEFNEENSLTLIVEKVSNNFYITNLTFTTPGLD